MRSNGLYAGDGPYSRSLVFTFQVVYYIPYFNVCTGLLVFVGSGIRVRRECLPGISGILYSLIFSIVSSGRDSPGNLYSFVPVSSSHIWGATVLFSHLAHSVIKLLC